LVGQLKTSRPALQVGEATGVVKDANVITYVQYVLENDMKEGFVLQNY